MVTIRKVLIANRGEIAVCVMRSAKAPRDGRCHWTVGEDWRSSCDPGKASRSGGGGV